MPDCEKCGGSRHVWSEAEAAYVPCECLRAQRGRARYRAAGVPERFDEETWRTFLDGYRATNVRALLGAARLLVKGEQPDRWILLHGLPSKARDLCSALVLRSACDGRMSARWLDLPMLIENEFDGRSAEPYELDVISLQVGGEPAHKWNRHVLERALRDRWAHRRFTLLVVDGDVTRLGALYKSPAIEEALRERFDKVRLEAKPRRKAKTRSKR